MGAELKTVLYSRTFDTLRASHIEEEIHELLALVCGDSQLEIVKVELHHPILGVDGLLARLE